MDGLLEGGGDVEMQRVTRYPLFRRSVRIRTAAQKVLLELDASTKWHAALSSGFRPAEQYRTSGSKAFIGEARTVCVLQVVAGKSDEIQFVIEKLSLA